MVTLPSAFVATHYPGYFWNLVEKKLYSLKSGVLRELVLLKPNRFNHLHCPAYRISHKGMPRYMSVNYLNKLVYFDSVIPVEKK